MRSTTITQTGVGSSAVCPVDFRAQVFAIGIGCVITGTVTYSVQHTFDDIYDPTIIPTWFTNAYAVNQSANIDTNYAFPIKALRVTVSAGTGSVAMTVLQTSGQG